MQAKSIQITIDPDGNCTAEGIGFMGAECERALREIDAALGTRTATRYKPEHYAGLKSKADQGKLRNG